MKYLCIVLFFLPFHLQAQTQSCAKEAWAKAQKQFKLKTKVNKIPSLFEIPVEQAVVYSEHKSKCQVARIQSRLYSNRWKSLCGPEYQTTKIRCYRSFLNGHHVSSPSEIKTLSKLAVAAVVGDRSKQVSRNRDVLQYQILESLLFVYEKANPSDFDVTKLTRVHDIRTNNALKEFLSSEKKRYSKAKLALIKEVDSHAAKLGEARRPASQSEESWMNRLRPILERRIKSLKTIDRPWK